MNQAAAQQRNTSTKVTVIDQFRADLRRMEPQFAAALPAHVPVERFCRVVMTAIQNNPKLLNCSRQSLFSSCLKAAADGLMPDGREGAIVPFGEEDDDGSGRKRQASPTASWMPMVAGIRKKARNSGEIADWFAEVVHDGDHWRYEKGENPIIEHIPSRGGRKRPIIAAYSVCRLKDGTISREWMWIEEIEDVRQAYSRSRKGPWSDPVAYPEMCKKTVVRLHSKTLPMSTDVDDIIRRDDEFTDPRGSRERAPRLASGGGTTAALEHFGNEGGADASSEPDDRRPGDETVIEHGGGRDPGPDPGGDPDPVSAFTAALDKAAKQPPTNMPAFKTLIADLIHMATDVGGQQGALLLENFWVGNLARTLRNKAGLVKDDSDAFTRQIDGVIASLSATASG
jgi:recombination protein RecT